MHHCVCSLGCSPRLRISLFLLLILLVFVLVRNRRRPDSTIIAIRDSGQQTDLWGNQGAQDHCSGCVIKRREIDTRKENRERALIGIVICIISGFFFISSFLYPDHSSSLLERGSGHCAATFALAGQEEDRLQRRDVVRAPLSLTNGCARSMETWWECRSPTVVSSRIRCSTRFERQKGRRKSLLGRLEKGKEELCTSFNQASTLSAAAKNN